MKAFRFAAVAALMLSGVFTSWMPAGAAQPASGAYTCTGSNNGVVPPGTYRSVTITGVCFMPAGTIRIRGDLRIAAGALLDAVTPGDPSAANPLVPASVSVGGDVSVGRGGVLLLGCSPNISCPTAVTDDSIHGDLVGNKALGVVIHSTRIGGNVSLRGGGGGTSACSDIPPVWLADPALANGEGPGSPVPVYSDLEDNSVGGGVSIVGLKSCWLGTLRNVIGRSARITNNAMGDPDAMEVGNNRIKADMICRNNDPAAQFGDGSAPNIVGRRGVGECGFGVVLPNPAVEAGDGGVDEHFTVPAKSLSKNSGTHTQTANVRAMTFGTTTSGDTLVGQLNNVVFAGHGLKGPATVDPAQPPFATGEGVLISVHPDGSQTFTALDTCSPCRFHGKTGTVMIRAEGTVSRHGLVRGRFLVTGASGDLATLAGYGTFRSAGKPGGNTLRLTEYLKIT